VTSQPSKPPVPLEVFYSYSHKDEKLRDKLDNHLTLMQRQGFITEWHDRRIEAGDEWGNEISAHLNSAHIILLLVSDDFIASDYCYSVEMGRALERHEQEEARVIPIILRPVDWESSPLGKLQALPKNGKAVSQWRNRDEAFKNIAQGIRKIILSFSPKQAASLALTYIPRRPVFGFVARRDAQGNYIVERLKAELAPGQDKLVTLSGPGGIGKSTLAAEIARELEDSYEGRVVWSSADGRADLTLLALLDDIATQLGHADLRTLAPVEKETQVHALVAESATLIVLDNCETIAGEEHKRIEAWFAKAQCSALFTSRPRIAGTAFVQVSAMSRDECEEFLGNLVGQTQDAQIFTPEVRRRVYETAEANPFVMQWVVAQIDLAQEPGAVLQELKHGKGDAAQRVFDRSFDLSQLGDDGRDALLALSLFAPSAKPDALSAVAGFDDAGRVSEAVKNLRRLWLVKGVDGNRRLAVEGLTRTLADARLSRDTRADEFRNRFVAYFLRYAVEHEKPTPENYDALEENKDNLLRAEEEAFAAGDWGSVMRMAYVLAHPVDGILSVRGYWDEVVKLGEQALQAARSSQDEAQIAGLSHNVAVMYANRGELAEARRLYDESLEINKRLGNQSNVASTLHQLGRLAQNRGEIEEARRLYDESLEINKRLGDQSGVADTLHNLAVLAQDQGEIEEARRLYDESLEIEKRLGDQSGVASTLHELGRLAQGQGEIEEARRLFDESLEIKKRLGNQSSVAITLHELGRLAQGQGEIEEARRLFDESLEIEKRLGNQSGVAITIHALAVLAAREGNSDEARRLYNESLEITNRLGDKSNLALIFNNLGMLAKIEENKPEAARLFREALSIFEKLRSPYAEIARRNLAKVEGESS
jgi:tetratricopeptide (TPR) repeat protein/energy-coupling factor transporter ATP-binding protein EcfA2